MILTDKLTLTDKRRRSPRLPPPPLPAAEPFLVTCTLLIFSNLAVKSSLSAHYRPAREIYLCARAAPARNNVFIVVGRRASRSEKKNRETLSLPCVRAPRRRGTAALSRRGHFFSRRLGQGLRNLYAPGDKVI